MEKEPFVVSDRPELVGLDALRIENDSSNGDLRRIAHFRWQDRDFWLLGKMVWHNRMAVGAVFIRPKRGRRTVKATLMVLPDYRPPEFVVYQPRMRRYPKDGSFVFVGFDPSTVIDIEFARQDDRRLQDIPYTSPGEKGLQIPKPPKGQIV